MDKKQKHIFWVSSDNGWQRNKAPVLTNEKGKLLLAPLKEKTSQQWEYDEDSLLLLVNHETNINKQLAIGWNKMPKGKLPELLVLEYNGQLITQDFISLF